MKPRHPILLALWILIAAPAAAEDQPPCQITDKLCVMGQLEGIAKDIEEERWRDQTYRELAKSYTYAGHPDKAIALIDKIVNSDTKAMTVRGIGFAAADSKWDKPRYDKLFADLTKTAEKIDHPPSYAIALTYIAMSQAFAGDDEGATKTAAGMENDALRNKAFGESAEIQAERGDYAAAMASISHIGSSSFRNKSYRTTSKIFVGKNMLEQAYNAALKIDNTYMQAEALQTILNHGNAEEELK